MHHSRIGGIAAVTLCVGATILTSCSPSEANGANGRIAAADDAADTGANAKAPAANPSGSDLGGDAGREGDGAAADVGSDADAGRPIVPDRVIWFLAPWGRTDGWRTGTTVGPELAPLSPLQRYVTLIDGVDARPSIGPGLGNVAFDCPACLLSSTSTAIPLSTRRAPVETFDVLVARRQPIGRVQDVVVGMRSTDPTRHAVARSYSGSLARRPHDQADILWDTLFVGSSAACVPPRPAPTASPDQALRDELAVVVGAFNCDAIRTATVIVDGWGQFSWLNGQTLPYIEQSFDTTTRYVQAYREGQIWMASLVATLAMNLASRPTLDGKTLLDHTLIVWPSDAGGGRPELRLSDGLRHIVVGSTPRWEPNQYIQTTASEAQFLATIGRAIGLTQTDLGADYSGLASIAQLLAP